MVQVIEVKAWQVEMFVNVITYKKINSKNERLFAKDGEVFELDGLKVIAIGGAFMAESQNIFPTK